MDPDQSVNKSRLFVNRLDAKITKEDLMQLFRPFGDIVDITFKDPKNFAFVQYRTEFAGTKAKNALDMSMFHERKINVNYAKQRPHNADDIPNRGGKGTKRMGEPMRQEEMVNDVEIICLNKHSRLYSEQVEKQLKMIGLNVDILFPNPEISLAKVIGSIARRGVMFALCITPENEAHRSLTVNVLQGEQQEHRNMPIDEALAFVAKNFGSIIQSSFGGGGMFPPPNKAMFGGGPPMRDPMGGFVPGGMGESGFGPQQHATMGGDGTMGHPKDIQTILGFLVDDRPMSIMEYDKLIKYLVHKRESTLKAEYGSNIPPHLLLPPVGPGQDPVLKAKQEEIQTRLMEILNKPKLSWKAELEIGQQQSQQQTERSNSRTGSVVSDTNPANNSSSAGNNSTTAGGLNPALQKAIDSLGPSIMDTLKKMEVGKSKSNDSSNLDNFLSSLKN